MRWCRYSQARNCKHFCFSGFNFKGLYQIFCHLCKVTVKMTAFHLIDLFAVLTNSFICSLHWQTFSPFFSPTSPVGSTSIKQTDSLLKHPCSKGSLALSKRCTTLCKSKFCPEIYSLCRHLKPTNQPNIFNLRVQMEFGGLKMKINIYLFVS